MNTCKNCFEQVQDLRSAKKCDECGAPMHSTCVLKTEGTYCDVCFAVSGAETKIKQTKATVDMDVKLPDHIRRTYIELYKSCPYKFLKEVIEDNPQPATVYTQLGIDLHELFEDAQRGEIPDAESMKILFESRWNQYPVDWRTDVMWKRAETSIEVFYSILPSLPKDVFAMEEKLIFSIGADLPDASITMDRIDEIDGELELSDWKTGKVMVGQKISSDLQAPLYIHAVRTHYGKQVRKFTFYYVNENKIRVFERSPIDPDVYVCKVVNREYKINITDAIREVQSIFSQIKNKNFNVPTDSKKMYFTCKMCHIKEQGACAGAEEQVWYQYN